MAYESKDELIAGMGEECRKRNADALGLKSDVVRGKRPISPEEDFCKAVIEFARLKGWKVAHFRPGMTQSGKWRTAVQGDGKGFPDLVMVRERVIYAELKTDTGKLSDEQENWGVDLHNAGQEWYVWRPSAWGAIEQVLGGLA